VRQRQRLPLFPLKPVSLTFVLPFSPLNVILLFTLFTHAEQRKVYNKIDWCYFSFTHLFALNITVRTYQVIFRRKKKKTVNGSKQSYKTTISFRKRFYRKGKEFWYSFGFFCGVCGD